MPGVCNPDSFMVLLQRVPYPRWSRTSRQTHRGDPKDQHNRRNVTEYFSNHQKKKVQRVFVKHFTKETKDSRVL